MIMRIYRCTVIAGKEAAFREFAFSKRHPWLKGRPGLIAFYAGKPLPSSDGRTRCMTQIWESAAAIQAALGEDWNQPVKIPEDVRDIIDSAMVEHFEVADSFIAGTNPAERATPV